MSIALRREPAVEVGSFAPKPGRSLTFYWVIGGCYGDDSRSWRRWSEVIGPYADRDKAVEKRGQLLEIFRNDPRVHFEVVRADEESATASGELQTS